MTKNRHFCRKDIQAYINSAAILHNVKSLKNCCDSNVKFCAVVKANAYGHGIKEIINILKNSDTVDFFAVASIYEAIYIAEAISNQQIFVLEPLSQSIEPEAVLQCQQKNIHCSISDLSQAEYVHSLLREDEPKLNVHMNIDTGMGRSGADIEKVLPLVEFIHNSKKLCLAGIYTHFATSDSLELTFALKQLKFFKQTLQKLDKFIDNTVIIHACNSAATMRLPDAHFDMVRCGISIYGYNEAPKPLNADLKPAIRLETPIVHINTIKKGQTVSYGRTFTANTDTKIAILPIGYSDGFCRCLSNNAAVIVNSQPADVIGTVTMNQIVINITGIEDVKIGTKAIVIDDNLNSPASVYALAAQRKSICYEILTDIPLWAKRLVK